MTLNIRRGIVGSGFTLKKKDLYGWKSLSVSSNQCVKKVFLPDMLILYINTDCKYEFLIKKKTLFFL